MTVEDAMETGNAARSTISGRTKRILQEADTVVFDCDGTLIDVSESYDATIAQTAGRMLKGISSARLPLGKMAPNLIMLIRRTGGFNNDWDTTYALTLFSVAALAQEGAGGASERLERLVSEFAAARRLDGYRSVDDFLAGRCGPDSLAALNDAREHLGYPGDASGSLMARVFDETYFGRALFKKVYGTGPMYVRSRGLIERDKVLVSRSDLERISAVLGGRRMAVTTGRPFVAAEFSLRRLMAYFDREASTYIGDADIYPELVAEFAKYRKPSGASLIRALERFSSRAALYVGDSMEDLIMTAEARRAFPKIAFAGVYGTATDEEGQEKSFKDGGADITVREVGQVPDLLEMVRR